MYSVLGALCKALGIQEPHAFCSPEVYILVETDDKHKNKVKVIICWDDGVRVINEAKP